MRIAGTMLIGLSLIACGAVMTTPAPVPEPPKILEFTFPLAFPGNTRVCAEVNKPVMFSSKCITLTELRAIVSGHKL